MDENHFDRLSDDLLRLIFNRVLDANSLCSCLTVSKRFASVVPQINTVSLAIRRRTVVNHSDDHKSKSSHCGGGGGSVSVNFLRILIGKLITKPLHFLHRLIARNSSATSSDSDDEDWFHSADEALKSFNEIESLQIQLPSHGGEVGSDSDGGDSVLKWKAEFGTELKTCVILCATSLQKTEHFSDVSINTKEDLENGDFEDSQSILRSDELKLRIMWTISCIIAASARHYSLKQMISDRPTLRKIVVTDESKQGKLWMNEEQIAEMRSSGLNSEAALLESPSYERTRVPALSMKMCYVRALELPETGKVMKGATLVVIRAVDEVKREGMEDGDLLEGVFDGDKEEEALSEAVREMMKKKKSFTLEMDSF